LKIKNNFSSRFDFRFSLEKYLAGISECGYNPDSRLSIFIYGLTIFSDGQQFHSALLSFMAVIRNMHPFSEFLDYLVERQTGLLDYIIKQLNGRESWHDNVGRLAVAMLG
jgi:hypothetical protein